MKSNALTRHSPPFVFAVYIIAASALIMIFRYIFPGEISPLPVFSKNWKLIKALIEIITLFPALAFSGLVVPFGMPSEDDFFDGEESPQNLFHRFQAPIITAILAAVFYALLFFLILPLAQNSEKNMRFRGELYKLAKHRAETHRKDHEWIQASQFIGICDSVWRDSPEIDDLRTEVRINIEKIESSNRRQGRKPNSASVSALPGQKEPVDAGEAIFLGEAAFEKKQFLDAHWLATLAGRIARPGSPEVAKAAELAAKAWNQIEVLQISESEENAFALYRLKLSGYEAMVSGDWIRAYYIFREHAAKSPNDPDTKRYLAACEKGTKEIAFFIDEIEVSPGDTQTNAILSLPVVVNDLPGRSVIRIASLSTTPDVAYGIGVEYMAFDSQSRLQFSLYAPNAKILPITIEGRNQVHILMRALDRSSSAERSEPEWKIRNENSRHPDEAQIILDMSYEVFLEVVKLRQELPSLRLNELFTAAQLADKAGYIPQVYETEIFNRFGSCLFFLPMAIITIAMGWYFRARRKPRYLFVPLLLVFPLVFNGIVFLYRKTLSVIGASLILAVGFSKAFTLLIVFLALSFFISLIILVKQRG
ncbi:MAG: hypothetical protein LBU85_04965 [Treponema sp.]|jgi:hypothetical protein|nr:hypothetical protein [Treponema sp.]